MKQVTFAIGDIHGQLEPLRAVLGNCVNFIDEHDPDTVVFVFVGDYIDRGPDSRGVIDHLMAFSELYPCVFLRGNHEDMFLNDWGNFLHNGGLATMRSYGWVEDRDGYGVGNRLRYVPREHMDFFEATKLYHQDGLRTYVHAGINRHGFTSMQEESEGTMLWIRENFLLDPDMNGGYVVHGHTPLENGVLPMEKPNRVNVDTGSVFGGRLTAGIFTSEQTEIFGFIQDRSKVDGRVGEELSRGGVFIPYELIKKAAIED